jgi:hypothetical protein
MKVFRKQDGSKKKRGDEKRWKERGSSGCFFLPFQFSLFLHATLDMFQILN